MKPEEYKALTKAAYIYVWNIMGLGEFKEEDLARIQEENREKELFTNFSDVDINLNSEHLLRGYGNFGRDFLIKVMEQDKESAINMWETTIQQLLDLQEAVRKSTEQFEEMLKEKLANQIKDKESNS